LHDIIPPNGHVVVWRLFLYKLSIDLEFCVDFKPPPPDKAA